MKPQLSIAWKQPWDQASWAKKPMGRAVRGTWGSSGLSRGYKFSGKSRGDSHHRYLAVTKPQHNLQKTVYFYLRCYRDVLGLEEQNLAGKGKLLSVKRKHQDFRPGTYRQKQEDSTPKSQMPTASSAQPMQPRTRGG